MTPRSKKSLIAIFIATLVALVAIWAINGFEDTWSYVVLIIIAIPTSWFYFNKKNKGHIWISCRYLYFGTALSLPFLIANALVVTQSKIFLSLIRPFGETTSFEQRLVLALIALVGVGGLVTLLPILKDRRIYVVNAIVGIAFVAFALHAGYGIGYDFYKCDILKIPNCD